MFRVLQKRKEGRVMKRQKLREKGGRAEGKDREGDGYNYQYCPCTNKNCNKIINASENKDGEGYDISHQV